MHRGALLAAVILSLSAGQAPEQTVNARQSVAALERAAMAHARAGEFDKAEALLARALAAAPGDFKVLYNLGVAASFAGHHERAREVLETALRQQPQNVDVLYSLAYVDVALKQKEAALTRLAQAARLAPQRADIQKLLAIVTGDLGAWADSLAAWDRYLKLEPQDDFARRERGYTAVCLGQFEQGIADLEWFLARHPDDAVGHYQLGLAHGEADPAQALMHMDKALALKPDFVEARSARGSLYYRQGKPEAAVADLEFAAAHRPDNAINLDRLGQTYLALDRPADAVRALRRAAELAPEESRIQLHFGRALAEAGEAAESKVVMDRFRQLGPSKKRIVPAGLVEYLSLTPDEQRADYRARVEKAVGKNPGDAAAQLRHLQLLLDDGNMDQAAATARRLAGLKPGAPLLAGAGRALLASKQYSLARELLEQAAAQTPSAGVKLDLAIATFHAAGASAGLQHMDRAPESERSGDYYLARAQMLDASGKSQQAVAAWEQALGAAPERADLYQQAAAFLARNGRTQEALRVLDQAARTLPRNREILLMKATSLELARQTDAAERLLNQVQNRWPEWHAGWVAQGIILATRKRFEEARQALETAVALGARSSEAYYYLADCTLRSAPKRIDAAEAAIGQALKLAPHDPWIRSLARRIASRTKEPEPDAGDQPPYPRTLFQLKPPRDW